jgi:hypothetical protein
MDPVLNRCGRCKKDKPINSFSKDRSMKGGICNYCKECATEVSKNIRDKRTVNNKEKIISGDYEPPIVKKCPRCKGVWPSECFHRTLGNKDGLSYNCSACECNRRKGKRNTIEYRKYANKKAKERKQGDVNCHLACALRTRLNTALMKGYKSGSAVKDLGCSISYFRKYIEGLWTEGMNWDSYGRQGWHIDHIKPLVSFDLTDRDQLLQACNYKNMQPLWCYDNISKGGKSL